MLLQVDWIARGAQQMRAQLVGVVATGLEAGSVGGGHDADRAQFIRRDGERSVAAQPEIADQSRRDVVNEDLKAYIDPLTPDEQDCIADWLSQF